MKTLERIIKTLYPEGLSPEDTLIVKNIIEKKEGAYLEFCSEMGNKGSDTTHFLYMVYSYLNLSVNFNTDKGIPVSPLNSTINQLIFACEEVILKTCPDGKKTAEENYLTALDINFAKSIKSSALLLSQ